MTHDSKDFFATLLVGFGCGVFTAFLLLWLLLG
jgi:hypothetical protein